MAKQAVHFVREILAKTYALGKKIFLLSYFAYKKYFDDPHYWLVKKFPALFAAGHILDVGANVGYTSHVFGLGVSRGYKIFAFEPEPKNFGRLEAMVKLQKNRASYSSVQAAVGDVDGVAKLWINDKHSGDHQIVDAASPLGLPTLDVAMVTIDQFMSKQGLADPSVAFIKVDVQGFEIPALRGMAATIASSKHVAMSIEYDPAHLRKHGYEPKQMLQELGRLGFKSVAILNKTRGFVPFSSATAEARLKQQGYLDLLCTKGPLPTLPA